MNSRAYRKIDELLALTSEQDAFYAQLKKHRDVYKLSDAFLKDKTFQVAFIGNVGAGKTTSICNLLGLTYNGTSVLSTGSGRTTLCEVQIKKSEKEKIEIETYSNDEIKEFLKDYASYLKSTNDGNEQEGFKLSIEIERALRNMMGLKITKHSIAGKTERINEPKILADKFDNDESLFNEFMRLINLENRDKKSFHNDEQKAEMLWLHETFKAINSATLPNVSLSKKITLYVPSLNTLDTECSITFLDTKGVDQTVNRVDLDKCITNEKTISILCTRFNDSPDQTCSKMIDNTINAGLRHRLNSETILLVLDRAGEPEDVIDYDEAVGNKDEGREIRAEQINSELAQKFGARNIDVNFFNAKQDAPEHLLNSIKNKIINLINHHQNILIETEKAIQELESKIKSNSMKQANELVINTLTPWILKARSKAPNLNKFHYSLIHTIRSKGTYAASVRASVNRDGNWYNLDYYHELAHSARAQCMSTISDLHDELRTLLDNMLLQDKLKPSHSLLELIKNTSDIKIKEISSLALSNGRAIYEKRLKSDSPLWSDLYKQWGQGPGYKDRISYKTESWFNNQSYQKLEQSLTNDLSSEWFKYIDEVNSLLGSRIA